VGTHPFRVLGGKDGLGVNGQKLKKATLLGGSDSLTVFGLRFRSRAMTAMTAMTAITTTAAICQTVLPVLIFAPRDFLGFSKLNAAKTQKLFANG
jgi:hypothetical protein